MMPIKIERRFLEYTARHTLDFGRALWGYYRGRVDRDTVLAHIDCVDASLYNLCGFYRLPEEEQSRIKYGSDRFAPMDKIVWRGILNHPYYY